MSNRFNAEDYIDVQQRIVRFWSEYPDGAILTELMSPPDDFNTCRYKAIVFKHREDKTPSATGYAFEIAGGSGANRTSHEENCETSAIGRALANMGYATSGKDRASKQEMRKVQDGPQTRSEAPGRDERPRIANPTASASDKQIGLIKGLAHQKGISRERLEARCSQLYTKPLDQLTKAEASDLIDRLNAVPDAGQSEVVEHDNNPDDYEEVAMFNAAHADRFTN